MPFYIKLYGSLYRRVQGIFKQDQPNYDMCYPRFILNSSVLYYYVLKDYPIKFYTNKVVNESVFEEKCKLYILLDDLVRNDLKFKDMISK